MAVENAEKAALSLADAFHGAALGQTSWDFALAVLAAATGSKAGELVGLGVTPMHVITEVSPEQLAVFASVGGHDPALNPRVRSGISAQPMVVLDQADIEVGSDGRLHRPLEASLEAFDVPFACLTTLKKTETSLLGLSVLRTRKSGNVSPEQKAMFTLGAHHARNAMHMHMALERRSLDLTIAGLESLGVAALVLDRTGAVKAWSAPADLLLKRGLLKIDQDRLRLPNGADRALTLAIGAARAPASEGGHPPRSVLTQDEAGLPFMIEVMAMPDRHGFPWSAAVLVVAKPPRKIEAVGAAMAKRLFGLTRTEATVAGMIAAGLSAQAIADRHGVGLATTRTHIRRVLEKSGAHSQLELAAAILVRL